MAGQTVWTFFYGSYMNAKVLQEIDLAPERFEVASLRGFDIAIKPLANLFRSDRHTVYGIVAKVTHTDLARLYAHARDVLGGTYHPEPVLVDTENGERRPALCYVAPSMESRTADNEYIDRIVGPAREFGFPDWYIQRLESFRP